jgi:hypothetical protein
MFAGPLIIKKSFLKLVRILQKKGDILAVRLSKKKDMLAVLKRRHFCFALN